MTRRLSPINEGDRLSTGQCATLACLLEVSAPKPGNVHRGADFEKLTIDQFAASAVAIGPAMDRASQVPLGQTVLSAVRSTRQRVGTNTNLGTILLLAPLAAADFSNPRQGVAQGLDRLTAEDSALVYEAIRLASPGSLGHAEQHDINDPPPDDLLEAMQAAAERDLVARQYSNQFAEVFEFVGPKIVEGVARGWTLPMAIIDTHLHLMSQFPDSLIARKCGEAISRESADRASAVLSAGEPTEEEYQRALADLDFWLRCDGHRRNPGTSADLIAAGLFVALRQGLLDTALHCLDNP